MSSLGEEGVRGSTVYSKEEVAELRAAVRAGRTPLCPNCQGSLIPRSVPPREEVAYVRARTWWICPGCKRSAVLDRDPSKGGSGQADPSR